jgi:hypothetical protein
MDDTGAGTVLVITQNTVSRLPLMKFHPAIGVTRKGDLGDGDADVKPKRRAWEKDCESKEDEYIFHRFDSLRHNLFMQLPYGGAKMISFALVPKFYVATQLSVQPCCSVGGFLHPDRQ